ncbi:MAG TPA: hypothetical protein VJ783_10955 [Pirellulales bacterium]|nr:hypothetical protein [Pirellulales bacterium]
MSSEVESELVSFHRFVADQLRQGHEDVSPEKALDRWRTQHLPTEPDDDAVLAVQEALDGMKSGDQGIPITEFDREFRIRHGLRAE